jgi:hypothetical protein
MSSKKNTRSINFGNKKGFQICSSKVIKTIKKNIKTIGNYCITGKYYNFLNKKNINTMKDEGDFKFTLNSFGKKYLLFLTRISNNRYCVFIYKKNETMIITAFRFTNDLFDGTLFDGELIKNNENKWVFIIYDIIYIKGINIVTKSFEERQEILNNILKNKYSYDNNSVCSIEIKKYYDMKYIQSVYDDVIPSINYKISGILFKNEDNFSDNYLYIFPECRSDNKILKNCNIEENDVSNISQEKKKEITNKIISELKRNYCYFEVRPTEVPDIFELYCYGSNRLLEKHSYASVIKTSESYYLKKIFKKKINEEYRDEYSSESELDEDDCKKKIIFKCVFNSRFKKWKPIAPSKKPIDNINTINQLEIYFENMKNMEEK